MSPCYFFHASPVTVRLELDKSHGRNLSSVLKPSENKTLLFGGYYEKRYDMPNQRIYYKLVDTARADVGQGWLGMLRRLRPCIFFCLFFFYTVKFLILCPFFKLTSLLFIKRFIGKILRQHLSRRHKFSPKTTWSQVQENTLVA